MTKDDAIKEIEKLIERFAEHFYGEEYFEVIGEMCDRADAAYNAASEERQDILEEGE